MHRLPSTPQPCTRQRQRVNSPETPQSRTRHDDPSPLRDVDWQDFREHLATADKDGSRRWIFARKPSGRYYQARTALSLVLLVVMFAGPFIRINGNPLLMFNIVERRFSILGQLFWPQDTIIFAVAMLVFLTGILIFTTAFGRLWCGWTCPQTVMMEMVFRKLEYLIEGDATEQRALAREPWTPRKIALKGFKHLVFLALSFLVGNTLLSYIIGSDALLRIIRDNPANHVSGLTFMVLFTLLFYAIFARFREQACTFICPYGRFQSALLDENTLVVAYDHKRGEKRGHLSRSRSWEERQSAGQGDCVDCAACVAVCPTGIDIRNGTQMECVNCTACIDACDHVMEKLHRPRGLIRFASLNNIEKGEPQRFTARMKVYTGILTALISLFLLLVFTRSEVQPTLLRAPGALFQAMPNGRLSNLYTLKLINKTSRDITVALRLENTPGDVRLLGHDPRVPAGAMIEASVLIELDANSVQGGRKPLTLGLYSGERRLEKIRTVFVGPRN